MYSFTITIKQLNSMELTTTSRSDNVINSVQQKSHQYSSLMALIGLIHGRIYLINSFRTKYIEICWVIGCSAQF